MTTTTSSTITSVSTAASITVPLPDIPVGGIIVNWEYRYVEGCSCLECVAHNVGLLYYSNHLPVPAGCLTRSAPHEYAKDPPGPNTDAWRERSARGSKLLRGLLTGEQLKVWDRFRSLIIRYDQSYDCGDDCCVDGLGRSGATGLLITPEDDRTFGRWEFNQKGELIHIRNIWSLDRDSWSYEDELISLLLAQRNDPVLFIGTGCRDRALYHTARTELLRAKRIMRRIGRFSETTKEGFALADKPGMFAGSF